MKNWSSSVFQSPVVQLLPPEGSPAPWQKCPLKWVPISFPAASAALRLLISTGRSAAVFQLISEVPGL